MVKTVKTDQNNENKKLKVKFGDYLHDLPKPAFCLLGLFVFLVTNFAGKYVVLKNAFFVTAKSLTFGKRN